MSVHAGHRKRLKERFRQEGLDSFDELHVLELLLFYCIPQKDTNLLAHELLDRFGSLPQVLEATAEELEKVPGVGEHVSTLLTLITDISRYYMVSRSARFDVLLTNEQCGDYLLPYFVGRRDETVFMLCLDAKCKVLCCKEVGRGSVNSAGVPVRRVVETALGVNATGLAIPSSEDIITTRRIAIALDAVGIVLADHIVVADDDFVSMVDSAYYRPEECQLPL